MNLTVFHPAGSPTARWCASLLDVLYSCQNVGVVVLIKQVLRYLIMPCIVATTEVEKRLTTEAGTTAAVGWRRGCVHSTMHGREEQHYKKERYYCSNFLVFLEFLVHFK